MRLVCCEPDSVVLVLVLVVVVVPVALSKVVGEKALGRNDGGLLVCVCVGVGVLCVSREWWEGNKRKERWEMGDADWSCDEKLGK